MLNWLTGADDLQLLKGRCLQPDPDHYCYASTAEEDRVSEDSYVNCPFLAMFEVVSGTYASSNVSFVICPSKIIIIRVAVYIENPNPDTYIY